jgi:hypothetical protein
MKTKAIARTILRYEIAAFGLLVVLSWADELLGVPALARRARRSSSTARLLDGVG